MLLGSAKMEPRHPGNKLPYNRFVEFGIICSRLFLGLGHVDKNLSGSKCKGAKHMENCWRSAAENNFGVALRGLTATGDR